MRNFHTKRLGIQTVLGVRSFMVAKALKAVCQRLVQTIFPFLIAAETEKSLVHQPSCSLEVFKQGLSESFIIRSLMG
jgi:hypothetical protein